MKNAFLFFLKEGNDEAAGPGVVLLMRAVSEWPRLEARSIIQGCV